MPELTIEWRSVAKEPPPVGETVLVWYRGRVATALWKPAISTHCWIIYPPGACPVAPYPQYHPKWWMPMIAAPSDEPVAWGPPTDFGEIHVVWRGSVTDLYTDLFPLLTPPQLSELGRKLIGQPGGHVDRMARADSRQPTADSSGGESEQWAEGRFGTCNSLQKYCTSPDGHCSFHPPNAWRHRKKPETLEDLVRGCHSINGLIDDLKKLLGGDGDWWRAFQHEMGKERQPPIPMLLRCPSCNERHIDEGEFAAKPHHTHACQICGEVWRPAIVNTVGVHFLPGFKNERTAAREPPGSIERDMLLRVRELIDRVIPDTPAGFSCPVTKAECVEPCVGSECRLLKLRNAP